jgi:tetratricopeptide (TPR) repeat protein
VKYCPECGYNLDKGTEKYCPNCGEKLGQMVPSDVARDDKNSSNDINETKGDIIGTGFSGSGNIVGKEVAYCIQGNVLNFNISGESSISKEFIEQLQKMVTVSTQLESPTSSGQSTRQDNLIKLKETSTTKQQITNILDEVNIIEKKEGTSIQEIKAGNLQISRKELSLKDIILKGNEHIYKKEYSGAIRWYDKAIKIDPNNASAWTNKGLALAKIGKHNGAIECFDKALGIDPNNILALNNKGISLHRLKKHNGAIEYYDKALQVDPNNVLAWTNKGAALAKIGKHEEAIENFDKALQVDPNNPYAWTNKGYVLHGLGKYKEAIEYYDKALQVDPNNVLALNIKGAALNKLGRHKEAKELTQKKQGWKRWFG